MAIASLFFTDHPLIAEVDGPDTEMTVMGAEIV